MFRFFSAFLLGMSAVNASQPVETLALDIIPYEKFIEGDADALLLLNSALYEKGIVGIRGIPGYKEKYAQFVEAARSFNDLPEDIKDGYKPNRELGETFLGYELGKEKFQRPDGEWVTDDLKASYYAIIPDADNNKWPLEVNLKGPYEQLGELMAGMGEQIMYKIGLLGANTGLYLEEDARLGRMLYYRKNASYDNPYWCGAHFDHGLFTVILPAVYFSDGQPIEEPEEAGLFVRVSPESPFKKVVANDLDVMMFQVGEFGQLVTHDGILATEHRVHKAVGAVDRYTMGVFYNAPMDKPIYSRSVLTSDARYGAAKGEACTYRHWHEASFKRYVVAE
jgi:isopenicillin N synthase-like dioxygenase